RLCCTKTFIPPRCCDCLSPCPHYCTLQARIVAGRALNASWSQPMNAVKVDSQVLSALKLTNVEDIYQLSPMQQGMLFHSLFEPGAGMYLIEMAFELKTRLNVQAFRQAWDETIRRHAVLRTAFLWEGLNKPMQVVRERVELPWREEDWRGGARSERDETWEQLLCGERHPRLHPQHTPPR